MTPQPGSIIAQRFQLVRELGHGTMGTVWLAQHLTLDLRCAVKFMTAEATRDPNYMARFELEARAVAQLQSPNVVRVLDYDVSDGVPFIAMELLHGQDLGARLRQVGRLDFGTTQRIIAQVARGLSRAHASGIVHRDLKPENIFLAQEDDDEVAKLLDFGIAKVSVKDGTGSGTQMGSVLGTPVYMSPEQARGVRTIDHRSDLWSLAVITYECLTGQLPFDGQALGDVFARIMFDPIPVPSEVAPHLPPSFDRWWARAVSRDVEGRFSSAREMSDALAVSLGLPDPMHASRASRPELASAHSVEPIAIPKNKRSGLVATLIAGSLVAVGALATHARIDGHGGPSDLAQKAGAAAHAIARPIADFLSPPAAPPVVPTAPRTTAATTAAPVVPVAPVASAAPPAPPAPEPEAAPVQAPSAERTARLPDAPVEAPATVPTGSSLAAVPQHSPPPSRTAAPRWVPSRGARRPSAPAPRPAPAAQSPARAADDTPAADAVVPGAECSAGQHRCQGTMLQVCNSMLDGWADVVDCADQICDATGSGRCAQSLAAPIAPDPPAAAPSEGQPSDKDNPYSGQ